MSQVNFDGVIARGGTDAYSQVNWLSWVEPAACRRPPAAHTYRQHDSHDFGRT